MTQVYIPSWGVKDPDDQRPKNFDAAGQIPIGVTITSFSVEVVGSLNTDGSMPATGPGPNDGALVISDVAWDPTTKRVSFWWAGGTLGVWYLVRCRIGGGAFSCDQSAKVFIGNK